MSVRFLGDVPAKHMQHNTKERNMKTVKVTIKPASADCSATNLDNVVLYDGDLSSLPKLTKDQQSSFVFDLEDIFNIRVLNDAIVWLGANEAACVLTEDITLKVMIEGLQRSMYAGLIRGDAVFEVLANVEQEQPISEYDTIDVTVEHHTSACLTYKDILYSVHFKGFLTNDEAHEKAIRLVRDDVKLAAEHDQATLFSSYYAPDLKLDAEGCSLYDKAKRLKSEYDVLQVHTFPAPTKA